MSECRTAYDGPWPYCQLVYIKKGTKSRSCVAQGTMSVVRHRGRDSGNSQQGISTVLWSLNEKQIEHPEILRTDGR